MKLPEVPPKLRLALKLGVSATLLVLLFTQVDWERGLALLRNADLSWVVAIFALYAADRVLMALKWHQLLDVLGGHLSRSNAIRVYYESSFVGFALPLGGLGPDIVRFLRLRGRGVDPHATLASMVMERLIGVVAALAVVAVAFAVLSELAPETALRRFAAGGALALAVGAVLAALLIFHRPATRAAMRLSNRIAPGRRIDVDKYRDAAKSYANRRAVLGVNLVLSMVEQLAPVMAYWIGSRALGAPFPFLVCLAVAPVTAIIQRLPVSYAGLGLREGSATALLVALGYDYSESLVLLMTLFMLFIVSLLPGALIAMTSAPPRPVPVERRVG